MRISLVHDPDLVNVNYRIYQPLQALARKGHEVHLNERGWDHIQRSVLMSSDAILIHRFIDAETQRLVAQARAAGIGVVWDNDDDILNVPRSNPNYRRYAGGAHRPRVVAELGKMLRAADVVTTPSEYLTSRFREAGAHDARVLENFLPSEFSRVSPIKHNGVTIVWLAGLEHQLDYQQLRLRETLLQLLETHDDLRVLSIGLGLGLPAARYDHFKLVEFLRLASTMAVGDIGIAPLVDVPFNRARSNIKVKEYAAAGLPWLASPVGAYVGLGEKQGGQLVADDQWHSALEQLIVDTRRRRKLAKAAAKWAKGQQIEKHAGLWAAALGDAATRAHTELSRGAVAPAAR